MTGQRVGPLSGRRSSTAAAVTTGCIRPPKRQPGSLERDDPAGTLCRGAATVDVGTDKIDETVVALLYPTLHHGVRAGSFHITFESGAHSALSRVVIC
jgi:hypothetical protein